jgi:GNAT superfamily N-acetyltransferase
VEEWPEFIFHDEGVAPYRERRIAYFPDWEFYLVDAERRLIGGCWGVPIAWDGSVEDLPGGFTDSLRRSVESHEAGVVPDTFVLMAAAVRNDEQGKGHASRVITAVRDRAVATGLPQVIAPVRPTLKSSYPLTDITEFMTWTRADGLPLDPWLRTHVRLGATILAPAPASQTMTGTVADWESWTGMALPATGTYVIPDGLTTLAIDREADTGLYREPNIWMRHR